MRKPNGNLLDRLAEQFRVRAFVFDRADGVRALDPASGDGSPGPNLADQLTATGEVTALGAALDDLGRRQSTANVAGLVVISDFNQNAGPGHSKPPADYPSLSTPSASAPWPPWTSRSISRRRRS